MAGKLHSFAKQAFLFADSVMGCAYRGLRFGGEKIAGNKVLFMTYQVEYACNPKYISDYLLAHAPCVDIVWVVTQAAADDPARFGIPEGVRLVVRGTKQQYEEMASAKVWVDNALSCVWRRMPKKDAQFYLDTWHGSLGIKRLDSSGPGKRYWNYTARYSNKVMDLIFTNSDFEDEVMHTAFWPDVQTMQTGHARNDILFDKGRKEAIDRKVRTAFGLTQDVKIALYAPTFHDDGSVAQPSPDNLKRLTRALSVRFGGTWVILVRMHYQDRARHIEGDDILLDATGYGDIQELLVAADVGITDYSSWIFEYVLTRKPGFILATDLVRYQGGRGLYYPLSETPFPVAETIDALCENIDAFDDAQYQSALEHFLKEKGCMEDGRACERIAHVVLDKLECDER